MASAPKISVCIPTFNRAVTLRNTIQAMLNQTLQDWEIIVGDDASQDNTEEVVRSFRDDRIRYRHNPVNLGIYENWNSLIKMASGDYICIFHDHDTYLPTILERCSRLLDDNANAVFVHTAILLVHEHGLPLDVVVTPAPEIMSGRVFQRAQMRQSLVTAATAMVRRRGYMKAGLYVPRFGLSADREMWLRLADLGDVGYVTTPQALIMARSLGDATSRFTWEDENGSLAWRRAWVRRLYPTSLATRLYWHLKIGLESNRKVLTHMAKAAFFEDRRAMLEEGRALAAGASVPTRAMIGAIAHSRVVRAALRLVLLPQYRSKLRRLHRQALEYCRRSPEIACFLPEPTNCGPPWFLR